jgi:glycosyltransferase involved in cell wall biosynthesis
MHVWLLTSEYPPDVAGGIATYVDAFARLLGAAGHRVVVIAQSDTMSDTSVASGVRLIRFCPRGVEGSNREATDLTDTHSAYPYNVLAYPPAVSYELAERVLTLCREIGPPDVVESQEYLALPYYLLQRKLTEHTALSDTPVVVHLHSPDFEVARTNQEPRHRFPRYWVGQMETFCIAAADALLSPSRFLARRIEEGLERPLDITCVPYPLPFSVSRNDGSTRPQPGELVYVGRLEVRKGVLRLVQACSRLWAAGETFRLTLIGGDDALAPLATTVGAFLQERYRLWIDAGRLRLLGRVDRSHVVRHLQDAWAVVLPSLWDNFPNVCVEAMALGQLVLASSAGGQAEMLAPSNGTKSGFLFDWEVEGDFEGQLREILRLGEERRRVICQAARARIRELCAPEAILEERIRHYERTIATTRRRDVFPTVNQRRDPPRIVTVPSESARTGLLSAVVRIDLAEGSLEKTLGSLRESTYDPVEILVVLERSARERIGDVLRRLESGMPHSLRVLETEDESAMTARNTGVDAARGEFITFVEPDDVIQPDYYSRAVDTLRRYANVSFVYPWIRRVGGMEGIWPTWNTELPYLLGQSMVPAAAVVRRALLRRAAQHRPEVEVLPGLEDLDVWLNVVLAGGVGVSLPTPMVSSRVGGGRSLLKTEANARIYLLDLLIGFHRNAYREWGAELVRLLNANGPSHTWQHPAIDPEGGPAAVKLGEVAVRLTDAIDGLTETPAERDHLEALKACRDDLIRVLGGTTPWQLSGPDEWYDRELGARLVKRIRRSRWGARALRHRRLRQAIRLMLEA